MQLIRFLTVNNAKPSVWTKLTFEIDRTVILISVQCSDMLILTFVVELPMIKYKYFPKITTKLLLMNKAIR